MISQIAGRAQEIPRVRVVGSSDEIRRVEREALQAARGDGNVLITGETGVGKSAVARFIHEHSARSPQGFATISCEGLPDRLFESELFGHMKGSFAGAYRDKPGFLESVHGGTVFLEEVGALSMNMQGLLLRFLETGQYMRIGSQRIQGPLDVRLMASTTENLRARVGAGSFLGGLYVLLTAVRLAVPSLRERRGDIASLVDHFAGEFAGRREMPTAVREALCRAEWRGNVRELKREVQRQLLRAGKASLLKFNKP